MRLYRFIFDIGAFMIVLYNPHVILFVYTLIHVWQPWIVRIPSKFDRISHRINVLIPFTDLS